MQTLYCWTLQLDYINFISREMLQFLSVAQIQAAEQACSSSISYPPTAPCL